MGDTILVNLGKGVSEKIVDKVAHHGENVTVTLYSESGRRPTLELHSTQRVETVVPD
jgi:hypothetical protein